MLWYTPGDYNISKLKTDLLLKNIPKDIWDSALWMQSCIYVYVDITKLFQTLSLNEIIAPSIFKFTKINSNNIFESSNTDPFPYIAML